MYGVILPLRRVLVNEIQRFSVALLRATNAPNTDGRTIFRWANHLPRHAPLYPFHVTARQHPRQQSQNVGGSVSGATVRPSSWPHTNKQ